jgi:hypothetical protein
MGTRTRSKNRKRDCSEGQEKRLARRGSLGCGVAQKGAAWLRRVRRGSDRVRGGSDSSASTRFTAGPSSNLSSAPQRSSTERKAMRTTRVILYEYSIYNIVCLLDKCKNNKKSGSLPPNL